MSKSPWAPASTSEELNKRLVTLATEQTYDTYEDNRIGSSPFYPFLIGWMSSNHHKDMAICARRWLESNHPELLEEFDSLNV